MAKDFNVYKWRRDHLINENELRGSWIDKKGTVCGKEYDGYYKTFFKQDSMIKAAIKDKGYTFIDIDDWEDDDRETEYWYYFKK